MTLQQMKKKVLGMIEELNPLSELLTDDPDISTKINDVINQILYELARMKKIPKYVEMAVTAGDTVTFDDIKQACGYEIYQLAMVSGVGYKFKANGTILKITETGTVEIDCYVYPTHITSETPDTYEFEVSNDILEIMPYGIAGDLLKSDVSTEYGAVYSNRYESMLQRLDPRYNMAIIFIEGGVSF